MQNKNHDVTKKNQAIQLRYHLIEGNFENETAIPLNLGQKRETRDAMKRMQEQMYEFLFRV